VRRLRRMRFLNTKEVEKMMEFFTVPTQLIRWLDTAEATGALRRALDANGAKLVSPDDLLATEDGVVSASDYYGTAPNEIVIKTDGNNGAGDVIIDIVRAYAASSKNPLAALGRALEELPVTVLFGRGRSA